MTDSTSNLPVVLLTGATGYVGGRLLKALEGAGVRLRCLARHPEYLRSRVSAETEIVPGDVLDAVRKVRELKSLAAQQT